MVFVIETHMALCNQKHGGIVGLIYHTWKKLNLAAFTLHNESIADFVVLIENAAQNKSRMSVMQPSSAVTDQFHSLTL